MMAQPTMQHTWILADLLADFCDTRALSSIAIQGLAVDSRKVMPGDLFFALSGKTVNGAEFINQALSQGANAILWDAQSSADYVECNWREFEGKQVPIIGLANLSELVGVIADRFYQHPSQQLRVCGITGTNGKTSCSHFIAQMLSKQAACGLLGTLGMGVYGELTETGFTTPDAVTCHRWLAEVQQQQAGYAVMEVSSHALTQGRVNGIHFDTAVFTNLSREHLDYHGDMQSYAEAKTRLFAWPALQHAVINLDDVAGQQIRKQMRADVQVLGYGMDSAQHPDVYGHQLRLVEDGLHMRVRTPWGEGDLYAPVIGRFNASNILAVLATLLCQGIALDTALLWLREVKSVPGRMQQFVTSSSPLVVIDYAHTPDALLHALTALREHTANNLWCVFGCGGDRDRGKRAEMGAIAEQYADHVVLTNDNPRSENPQAIIADIETGIQNQHNYLVEMDRSKAILHAIQQARQGDTVLVAGKGHENYQIIGQQKLPFSDSAEVQQQLARLYS